MAVPLLTTKLYIPSARSEWVPRPRLVEQLQAGLDRRLTLISAPAGFGKTTLLSQCIAHCDPRTRVAWLSLDQGDNDPTRFWTYVVAALQTIHPRLGETTVSMLQTPRLPPIEGLLTELINEIAALDAGRSVLVLDDFHLITEPQIYEGLAFLLDNLPAPPGGMHLIISGRSDLPWPIARLRARGELTELRPVDLRFTLEEVTAFLNDVMGLGLSPEDIAALDARTEGWIAGLQMAAISMRERKQLQGMHDLSAFIQTLTASHRFILDYLVEEVLDQQPPVIQAFLLQTSILEQMTASLCDAVTGGENSQAILDHLDQANLFLVPLDDERRWYRYHHLFGDLLRRRLEQASSRGSAQGAGHGQVTDLHRRASEWYEQSGMIAAAVGHALGAGDVERVARLTRRNALAVMDYDELATVVRWLDTLSDEFLRVRPWLGIACAWAQFYMGRLDTVQSQLHNIEAGLQDIDDAQGLAGHIAAIRCYVAAVKGKMSQAKLVADEALRLLPEGDQAMRGFVIALQSTILRWSGDLEAAAQASAQAVSISRAAQDSRVTMEALAIHGALLHTQGQMQEAFALCREALLLAGECARQQGRQPPVVASVHRLVSRILYEWNDLEGALRHARQGVALSEEWGGVEDLAFAYMGLARVLQATGDVQGALGAIQKGRQKAGVFSSWFGNYSAAHHARLWLAQGNQAAAMRWAQESGLSPDDEPGFQYIWEYSVLARVLTTQGTPDRALILLGKLLKVVDTAGAGLQVIENLILQALALQEKGDKEQALTALARALSLAEPEGLMRTFIDEGAPIGELLREAVRRGIAAQYTAKLLAVLDGETEQRGPGTPEMSSASAQIVRREPLQESWVEPLSDREQEVLRLLSTLLPVTEIAQELFISRHTVRTWTFDNVNLAQR
jgi:LuxR family maltose regulon positive regulatory protein